MLLGHHFQGQKVKGQVAGGGGILWRPPTQLVIISIIIVLLLLPQKTRWDCVKNDMESLGLSQKDAQFKNKWRRRIKGVTG